MSARTPRRSFLSPFVVTLASAPACFYQSSTPPSQPVTQPAPGQPEQADPHPTPPPPETQTPTIIANPPRPTSNPPPPTENPVPPPLNPPPPIETTNDGEWYITKNTRECQSRAITHCPPKVMCNPPPPHTYACIDGATYPAKVTKKGEVCTLESPHTVPCPK